MRKRIIRAIFIGFGFAVTLICIWSASRSFGTMRKLTVATTSRDACKLPPKGWKKIEVQEKAAVYIPQEMQRTEVLGDSTNYRMAFSNRDLRLTIIYGDSDSCAMPPHLVKRRSYQESVLSINGRSAKFGIDRYYEPKLILTYLCFPSSGRETGQLQLAAVCKSKAALETAQQIFDSVKFN